MTKIASDWLIQPQAQAVCAMLTDAGHQALFVGGCVRNELLGAPIADIDLTTDATPDQVIELATQAGFKPVPTGYDHGTVTVVVDHHPFEVTTFRKDVETDGRRATVAFASRVEDDAHRRDFTMNALYARPDGTVVDPLKGLPDLSARRVRFIDDAEQRIREDYLRILRFFRFHAWYGDPEGGLDADGLAAVAAHSAGIETLSRERVGAEMKRLLAAPNPAQSVASMAKSGVLAQVLAGADAQFLPILIHVEQANGVAPSAMRRLACLGGEDQKDGLRLSKAEERDLSRMLEEIGSGRDARELAYRYGTEAARDIALLRAALSDAQVSGTLERALAQGAAAQGTFPVSARDLMPDLQGAALGARLTEIESRWIKSGFALDREALLS
ncbi:CCA tRNA nucleotidyltransferase [Aliiroseovarius subalbicans]|uniref:CCA tRNA nucleotidyltransferase n=1 Tax=Aliiroseovarius subalbicans TaxID=2925840 RepID=UPI001F57CBF2|nr:CCA tRNA nucleotidyltransferase [Aliiroseovarius subalbicans]MCI2400040.1 CCA tRNA nucleotidyltransferase [Aliiroseovarius subalbicans]